MQTGALHLDAADASKIGCTFTDPEKGAVTVKTAP